MRIPFLKPKKKDESNHVHIKRKKVDPSDANQKRIQRIEDYKQRLSDSSEKRRNYGAKQ